MKWLLNIGTALVIAVLVAAIGFQVDKMCKELRTGRNAYAK